MSQQVVTLHLNGAEGHALPIRQGDRYSHTLTCVDGSGNPINKFGNTYLAQVRLRPKSTVVLATFTVTLSGAGNNILTWSLTDVQTRAINPGTYVWDLQEGDGNASGPVTLLEGDVLVKPDVSRVAA